ncbi:MAG: FlgD immunoglobulin-like domain containing protein [Vicinamibacteria bacterium]
MRTLVTSGPPEGLLEWDGFDGSGRVAFDGVYVFTVRDASGGVVGRARATLDTNRSVIHDAAGTGLLAIQPVPPPFSRGTTLAWMPLEDAVLAINHGGGQDTGLVRIGTDGIVSSLFKDPWYEDVEPAGGGSVSADGKLLLLRGTGSANIHNFYLLNLSTGTHTQVATEGNTVTWSPNGQFFVLNDDVFDQEGMLIAHLEGRPFDQGAGWVWSPDSRFLASGTTITSRVGVPSRALEVPDDLMLFAPGEGLQGSLLVFFTNWRPDGQIHTRIGDCEGDGCFAIKALLIDPNTGVVTKGRDNAEENLSPDGRKEIHQDPGTGASFVIEEGVSDLFLAPLTVSPSPRSSQATTVINGDRVIVRNLLNLTADARVVRLPGNSGLLISGIAHDLNFDHYQLDYADAASPGTWQPIGVAHEAPVNDDIFTSWVPPAPGTYLLRLRSFDRAGNVATSTQLVRWDVRATITNVTVDEILISPNGDGIKDSTTFQYRVEDPVHVQVRVVGPGDSITTIRTMELDHPTIGPASFTWDGRRDDGTVAADGRYTLFLNDLPFRLEVDATPPDIGWVWKDLRPYVVELNPKLFTSLDPEKFCTKAPQITAAALSAPYAIHVVDPHLRNWSGPRDTGGRTQLYVPDVNAPGTPLGDGLQPPVKRVNGVVQDREQIDSPGSAVQPGQSLIAEDYAGNRAVIPIVGVPEQNVLLEVDPGSRCEAIVERHTRVLPPILADQTYLLKTTSAFYVERVRIAPGGQSLPVTLQHRSTEGAAWTDSPVPFIGNRIDLLAQGVSPAGDQQLRFVSQTPGGELASRVLNFSLCDEFAEMKVEQIAAISTTLSRYKVTIVHRLKRPLHRSEVRVAGTGTNAGFDETFPLSASDPHTLTATFVAPAVQDGCPEAFLFFLPVLIDDDDHQIADDSVCLKLKAQKLPKTVAPQLFVEREFGFCSVSPDIVPLAVRALPPLYLAKVTVTEGDNANPVLTDHPATDDEDVRVNATVLPGVPRAIVRGFAYLSGDPSIRSCPAEFIFPIDRTKPVIDFFQPVEERPACPARSATGRETVGVTFQVTDLADVHFSGAALVSSTGTSAPALKCLGSEAECLWFDRPGRARVPRNAPLNFDWDTTGFADGEYVLKLTFCDASGNRTTAERRMRLDRSSPRLAVREVQSLFSPNGDGQLDTAAAAIDVLQSSILSAVIRAGSENGPVARTLFASRQTPTGRLELSWDGRTDGGVTVSDGRYFLAVSAESVCGADTSVSILLESDRTPPESQIVFPFENETLSTPSVDVRASATDLHFDQYELSVGAGGSPTIWTPISTDHAQLPLPLGVDPFRVAGRWDTATAGVHTLRLVTTDRAMNRTEVLRRVTVGERQFLERLTATPSLFSPNGDGRRETVSIQYGLLRRANVTLLLKSREGVVLKTFESGVTRETTDVGAFSWNGVKADGNAAAEGPVLVTIHLEDPAGQAAPEDASIEIEIDRIAPEVAISEPGAGSFVTRQVNVQGSITDPHLAFYRIDELEAGQLLASGSNQQVETELAPLVTSGDGVKRLRVTATDTAENERLVERTFTVDSQPPRVAITAPIGLVAKDQGPLGIIGDAEDDHLVTTDLAFGEGPQPGAFVDLAHGSLAGRALSLATWTVASLPDGPFILRLRATDRAGQTGETRSQVTLDGTPPVAEIQVPANGSSIGAMTDIQGVASDDHFASWNLEIAPGPAATAFQWSILGQGTTSLDGGQLASWPLPADGVYTLRLTVRDQVAHTSVTTSEVVVDTAPPATPQNLHATVTGVTGATSGDIMLTWTPNSEPDLSGYRVIRVQPSFETDVVSPKVIDLHRSDGTYRYSVTAFDRAGNQSPPALIDVRVDLTPPLASISFPAANAKVGGLVTIRGAAHSLDDFKEYRLSVGAGGSPASWQLLKTSVTPVLGGTLGEWVALVDGVFTLQLEAEDHTGNLARATQRVVVDTLPPDAPTLVSVRAGDDADTLIESWVHSAPAEVSGFLVLRNGHIANAPATVIGDQRAYAVAGPEHADRALPDGHHCYTIVALDEAGNQSPRSNELCATLDNRPPHAVLVRPSQNFRFDALLRLTAVTDDLDVASVLFQFQEQGALGWTDAGIDTTVPFESSFDPAGRTQGPYLMRAVATDTGGRVDPAPSPVKVIYGLPLLAPLSLTASVRQDMVRLSWQVSGNPDVVGYKLKRDGVSLTSAPLTGNTFDDPDRAPGSYRYSVMEVDSSGNEGPASTVDALVYAPTLDFIFPVTLERNVTLSGGNSQSGIMRVVRDSATVASVTSTTDRFAFPVVPLTLGLNRIQVAESTLPDNESLLSSELKLIANEAPPQVSGLVAHLDGRHPELSWTTSADAQVVGYVIQRDGVLLAAKSRITQAGVAAFPWYGNGPGYAFDGDPTSPWTPGGPSALLLSFPQPVLLNEVLLRFGGSHQHLSYRVTALVAGEELTVASADDFSGAVARHTFPYALSTALVTVQLLASEGDIVLNEVEMLKLDALPASTLSFRGEVMADGTHEFAVAAIDIYGAVGPWAAASLFEPSAPPSPPLSLMAAVNGSDVALTWTPSPEEDVVKYGVFRDGQRIGESASASYPDTKRLVGTYTYNVTAIDSGGLESTPSNAAMATILSAGLAPQILFPATAERTATVESQVTDVRGFADAGDLVLLDVNGQLAGSGLAEACYAPVVEMSQLAPPTNYWTSYVAKSGEAVLLRTSGGTDALTHVDLRIGARQDIVHSGHSVPYPLAFAASGRRLVYASASNDGLGVALFGFDLADGPHVIYDAALEYRSAAISPDGSRVAFSAQDGAGVRIIEHDWLNGTNETRITMPLGTTIPEMKYSPDGGTLAFTASTDGGNHLDLRMLDTLAGDVTDFASEVSGVGDWSPDGSRFAYGSRALAIVLVQWSTGESSLVTQGRKPQFDPTGQLLVYEKLTNSGFVYAVRSLALAGTESVIGAVDERRGSATWSANGVLALPQSDRLALLPTCERGVFDIQGVRLREGDNELVARALQTNGGATPDSEAVHVIAPAPAQLPDLEIQASGLSVSPAVPIVSIAASVRVDVKNNGTAALHVPLRIGIRDQEGRIVFSESSTLDAISEGETRTHLFAFTPPSPGAFTVSAQVDAEHLIEESNNQNNAAEFVFTAAVNATPVVSVSSDHPSYLADSAALMSVRLLNAGPELQGEARLIVETEDEVEVAEIDRRSVSLAYGASENYDLTWNTATTYAGSYRIKLTLVRADGSIAAGASQALTILPDLRMAASLSVQPSSVDVGAKVSLDGRVRNVGRNVAFTAGKVRLTIRGGSGVVVQTEINLPTLTPAAIHDLVFPWTADAAPGAYTAELGVVDSVGAIRAVTTAGLLIKAPIQPGVTGRLTLAQTDVLRGGSTMAQLRLTNPGTAALSNLPVAVQIMSSISPGALVEVTTTVTLEPGETKTVDVDSNATALATGLYPVILRAQSRSLDRSTLNVHAPVMAPSTLLPINNAIVSTSRPTLSLTNATGQEGATLLYEFQIFADGALTQPFPGAVNIPETPSTSWKLFTALTEDARYYWRARASDGFSSSAWSNVASFTVDEEACPALSLGDTLPAGILDKTYRAVLTVAGGEGPFAFTVTGGLPSGVLLDGDALAGKPSITGTFPMTVEATRQDGCGVSRAYSLVVGTAALPGDVVISEFRARGPAGARDEYVEIANRRGEDVVVAAEDGSNGWSIASTGGILAVIPNGTVLKKGGHWLATGPDFSLTEYPGGAGPIAWGDAALVDDLRDDSGVALFSSAIQESFNVDQRLDSVGSVLETDSRFYEGAPLVAMGPANPDAQNAWIRRVDSTALLVDTGNNSRDFVFVATDANTRYGIEGNVPAVLGAPGPEGLTSPTDALRMDLPDSLIDPSRGPNQVPNRVVVSGAPGSIQFRRSFSNATNTTLGRLRFKVIELTTTNVRKTLNVQSDLRVADAPEIQIVVSGSDVAVSGTTLELPTIYTSLPGSGTSIVGGLNSTLSASLPAPAAPGAVVRFNIKALIAKPGYYIFIVLPQIQGNSSPRE